MRILANQFDTSCGRDAHTTKVDFSTPIECGSPERGRAPATARPARAATQRGCKRRACLPG
eukprot:6959876-Alexandrium_andersonii.AAC.1